MLRKILGIDDNFSTTAKQVVLRKEDNEWMEKCIEYEVEGSRSRGPGERWGQKDCQAHKLNREYAMDCSRWKKLIKDG